MDSRLRGNDGGGCGNDGGGCGDDEEGWRVGDGIGRNGVGATGRSPLRGGLEGGGDGIPLLREQEGGALTPALSQDGDLCITPYTPQHSVMEATYLYLNSPTPGFPFSRE